LQSNIDLQQLKFDHGNGFALKILQY
jgi:hypothetical protein